MNERTIVALPPTPELPEPDQVKIVACAGSLLWSASYSGRKDTVPVLLLHGGYLHSNWNGLLISDLIEAGYPAIVMDTRGHGRSTHDGTPLTYAQMAIDACAVLDAFEAPRVDVVGWSDGGCIGYQMAVAHAPRVSRLFTYAANIDAGGVLPSASESPSFKAVGARVPSEYAAIAPDAGQLPQLIALLQAQSTREPAFGPDALAKIVCPTTIAHGRYEEAISFDHASAISRLIHDATFVELPGVGHFPMIERPGMFSDAVKSFLRWR